MTTQLSPNVLPICIAGPTASGKTALALLLAESLNAEIISVDALQVYKGFEIGSAAPSESERLHTPHHLVCEWEPECPRSVSEYRDAVEQKAREIHSRGKRLILVGGSNLYLSAVLSGIADLPPENESLRESLEELSDDQLLASLETEDPAHGDQYRPLDRRRRIRALEVLRSTGAPLRDHWARQTDSGLFARSIVLHLVWDRAVLYERINQRSKRMFEDGFEAEAIRLAEQLGDSHRLLKSIGYAQVVAGVRRNASSDLMIEEIAKQTRRFAKRQMTFWRNEPSRRGWMIRPGADEESARLGAEAEHYSSKNTPQGFSCLSLTLAELLTEIEQFEALEGGEVWHLDASVVLASEAK